MSVDDHALLRWKLAGLLAALVIVLAVPAYVVREKIAGSAVVPLSPAAAAFIGGESCRSCHEEAYVAWRGSHHDHAMAVASDDTVLGDFDDAVFDNGEVTARFFKRDGTFLVETQGPGGEPGEFEAERSRRPGVRGRRSPGSRYCARGHAEGR